MLVGSALCTAAPTNAFAVLLLGRALQGIASAGINVLCRTILADKVSLKENAKNWAVFSLVGGTSYALGPLIGGKPLPRAEIMWELKLKSHLYRIFHSNGLQVVFCYQSSCWSCRLDPDLGLPSQRITWTTTHPRA